MKYIIIWVSEYGREEIDETDTKADAEFLVQEYQLAYGGRVFYKKVRE